MGTGQGWAGMLACWWAQLGGADECTGQGCGALETGFPVVSLG